MGFLCVASEREYASVKPVSIVSSCVLPEMLCDDDPDVVIMEEYSCTGEDSSLCFPDKKSDNEVKPTSLPGKNQNISNSIPAVREHPIYNERSNASVNNLSCSSRGRLGLTAILSDVKDMFILPEMPCVQNGGENIVSCWNVTHINSKVNFNRVMNLPRLNSFSLQSSSDNVLGGFTAEKDTGSEMVSESAQLQFSPVCF